MRLRSGLIILGIGCMVLAGIQHFGLSNSSKDFSSKAKVVVREIGNQMLLANHDSSSLVLPVLELEKNLFQLSFQRELPINPDSLLNVVKQTLEKADIPERYRLEVIQCEDKEVAYSYEINLNEGNNIIPCRGRSLPRECYRIQLRLFEETNQSGMNYWFLIGIIFLVLGFVLRKKNSTQGHYQPEPINSKGAAYTSIGSYQFYPEQNKLIKKPLEIGLSKKECELLEILAENLNHIVKRDELTKRVWEDHGVVVGRSLDTYISKLRKKLKDDQSIKITNIHGVGYKLEISS